MLFGGEGREKIVKEVIFKKLEIYWRWWWGFLDGVERKV